LFQLELRAQASIAVVAAHSQHVRVQIGLWISVCGILPVFNPAKTWRNPPSIPAFRWGWHRQVRVEGADHLPANLLPHKEGFTRNDVAFVVAQISICI